MPLYCARLLRFERLTQAYLSSFLIIFASAWCHAAEEPPKKDRINPAGIEGSVMICGGERQTDSAARRFVELAGGPKAHLVVLHFTSGGPCSTADLKFWQALKPAVAECLQIDSRKAANEAEVTDLLRKATGVWIVANDGPKDCVERCGGTALETELRGLMHRGGIVGGIADGCRMLSASLVDPVSEKCSKGLDFLPGIIIYHGPDGSGSTSVAAVLKANPSLFAMDPDKGTSLIITGRELRVLGDGVVTCTLSASSARPLRTIELTSKPEIAGDYTQLRRAALARCEPPFPTKEVGVPDVAKGSLVIVGGGGMPEDITKKFIELAGGPDALIIVLPTANPDPLPPNAEGGFLQKAGAKTVKVVPARNLKDVEDPKYLEVLKDAKGIWFGGGRQWRFVDAYEGTKALESFRDVLQRGGVIGGSSAGATIQGDYLCRGSPLGNTEMMCEGYERGLGFLPGVAIDQHFAQRKRFADMTALVKTYPQILGIGIDESTALIVRGHVAEIMGKGEAHFYDRNKPVEKDKPDYESVKVGRRYDLKERKVVE
jgi:cyanophycinase